MPRLDRLRPMTPSRLPVPKAILFDMDGTLTKPMLDFPKIKAEMGIGSRPILEAMAGLDGPAREAAERVLHRHETHAATESELNAGCDALLAWIGAAKLPTALITRNSAASVRTVLELHGMTFDVVIAREDGPFKPDPWPILHACKRLNVSPHRVWMVGDGQYDIEAGNAAGVPTVWISHRRERTFASEPRYIVDDLDHLLRLLQAHAR
jgi:HAD superfamily hydrolase (TIGR01509 family)